MRLLIATLLCSSAVFAADSWVGTWKLNTGKSKGYEDILKGRVFTSQKIEAVGPNTYRETVELRNADGSTQSASNTATWDGKEWDNGQTNDDLPGKYTSSIQRVDNTHLVQIFKRDGKEYQRAEASLSPDGKVETRHQWGTGRTSGKPIDALMIYEKQ